VLPGLSGKHQLHEPLPETACDAESPGHFRSQVEPEQLTEQAPVQMTWQVAPALQEMLPLFARVALQVVASQLKLPLSPVASVQVLPPLQSALQEPAQLPTHSLPLRQLSEQLPPFASHPAAEFPVQVQLEPAEQVQLDPLQLQSGPGQADVDLLQPNSKAVASSRKVIRTDILQGRETRGPRRRSPDVD
jgi:hypothetical protein